MNPQPAADRAHLIKPSHVGDRLREWRQRRHLSQLDLACDAEISPRHLSFVETGRSAPSRDMVLKLAERLDVPLARAQRVADGRRLRTGVSAAPARRSRAETGAGGDRSGARSARAQSGAGSRSPLESGGLEPHGRAVARGHRDGDAGAAAQRAAAQLSSPGSCAAHRQSWRMVRAPAGAAASPV